MNSGFAKRETNSPKYGRITHLPFSPGAASDDKTLQSTDAFVGRAVAITEKLDGSNVCMERTACYARSHAALPRHESFDAFKAAHAAVKDAIPPEFQVFGEWLYAKHSIEYVSLPGYFAVFGVRDLSDFHWLSWNETLMWARALGFQTAPCLAIGWYATAADFRIVIEDFARRPSCYGQTREGVVVRRVNGFSDADFASAIAKYVRADHVQTDVHWTRAKVVRNSLAQVA